MSGIGSAADQQTLEESSRGKTTSIVQITQSVTCRSHVSHMSIIYNMQLVLAIGNHMNMGNIRIGQAQGFRITFLSQLRGLRTSDGTSTLLHFLSGLTERKFPGALEFPRDLSACLQASRGQ